MENQNNNFDTQPTETVMEIKPRRVWWKFAVGAVIILILAGGGYWAWDKYFSPQARKNAETQANYQKYLDWQKSYEAAMTADTYGGKTPQETVDLFVKALRSENTELITKYFLLGTDGKPRKEVTEGVQKVKDENRFQQVADIVAESKFDPRHSSDNSVWFTVENKKGEIQYSIILSFNKYSSVWKVEEL